MTVFRNDAAANGDGCAGQNRAPAGAAPPAEQQAEAHGVDGALEAWNAMIAEAVR